MIQPIMVTSQEPDGRIVQQTQYQIIKQSDENDSQNQVLQDVSHVLMMSGINVMLYLTYSSEFLLIHL